MPCYRRACLMVLTALVSLSAMHPVSGQDNVFAGDSELTISGSALVGRQVPATINISIAEALSPGDQLLLIQHPSEDIRLQVDDPAGENFVAMAGQQPLAPGYGARVLAGAGQTAVADSVSFKVEEPGLPPGSTVTLQVDRLVLPRTVTGEYRLPVVLRRGDDEVLLPGNSLPLSPGPLESLSLSANSLVRPAEDIQLEVEMRDRFGNVAESRPLTLDLLINGTFRQRVEVTASRQEIPGVQFEVPGVYQVEVRTGGGGLRAISNPVSVAAGNESIVWADIGVTSTLSDGLPAPAQLSVPRAGYDVLVPADHAGETGPPPIAGTDGITARIMGGRRHGEGSVLLLFAPDGREMRAALPETPTDLRYQTPGELKLAQVVAGGSLYSWLGDRVAGRGYRVGFIGTNHTHQYFPDAPEVYTAIRLRAGQDWFDALADGQTYVAAGSKIILDTNRELPMDAVRKPSVSIIAEEVIASVTVYKNGNRVAELVAGEPHGELVMMELASASAPLSPLKSLPRNAREWIGFISTRDAMINPFTQSVAGWQTRADSTGRRLDFYTRTHGAMRGLPFYMADVTPDTVIEIGLAEVIEDAAWLPRDRLPQTIRAQRFIVSSEELSNGAQRIIEATGYRDSVTLRRLPALEKQGEFTYEDTAPPRFGDYYYFVVRLLNGAFAISSPIYLAD